MGVTGITGATESQTLTVLLVNISGQPFGILITQIESLSAQTPLPPPASTNMEKAAKEFSLAASLSLPAGKVGQVSHRLWTKNGIAWQVEAGGQLIALPLTALRRWPRLLAPYLPRGLWGAAVYENDLILLLDLDQLWLLLPDAQ